MEFTDLARQRRSVRKFKDEPINKEEIVEIIRIATQAPSPGNDQMWSFQVVINEEAKEKMVDIVTKKLERLIFELKMNSEQYKQIIKAATFFVEAPAVIVVSTKQYRSKIDAMLKESGLNEKDIDSLRARPDLQSVGAAIQNLLLAAWEKGYGTCWMTGPCIARHELEVFLGITQPRSLAALIPIGKPKIIPVSRGRKPLEDVVSFIE
ncbi:MAG: nitroreductase [Firmicutes bacterium HGW-Firmicutes-12]|nr:MAG: nitroreductase [Firmicutes bacterium HGW-Firmicutes-12]